MISRSNKILQCFSTFFKFQFLLLQLFRTFLLRFPDRLIKYFKIRSLIHVCLMVFNATFNNISVISWRIPGDPEKTTDLSQVTDKRVSTAGGDNTFAHIPDRRLHDCAQFTCMLVLRLQMQPTPWYTITELLLKVVLKQFLKAASSTLGHNHNYN